MPILTMDPREAKKCVGEVGEVFDAREGRMNWRPARILRLAHVARVPFLSMSGYSEMGQYEVAFTDTEAGTSIAGPLGMRKFRKCGHENARTVLDGERWCPDCQRYL